MLCVRARSAAEQPEAPDHALKRARRDEAKAKEEVESLFKAEQLAKEHHAKVMEELKVV